MKYPYFCVNAFSKNSYSGNPAGVCILQEWLSTDELQKMATQVHLPETAFLFPSLKGAWSIRWFSPLVEIDLCGHAALAAAHVLYQEGFASDKDTITFSSSAGNLKVQKRGKQSVALEMPAISCRKSSISPLLVEGLGSYPDQVYVGMDCLCVFSEEERIEALNPDFRILSGIRNCRGIIVTAATENAGYDFISRFFGPRVGIDEDQVTGSSHCMLAPYWASKLKKNSLIGWQASQRGGEVYCELKGDRVILIGKSETFLRGEVEF